MQYKMLNGSHTMPRYFFHLKQSDCISLDEEGVVLSNDDHALVEAKQAAREMLAEKILSGDIVDGARFEVVRGDGALIATIPLRSVVRLD